MSRRFNSSSSAGPGWCCCFALLACSMHRTNPCTRPLKDRTSPLTWRINSDLNHVQARGALGALLVYAREQLPKPQFDQLATRFPNAEILMENVKAQGIVTKTARHDIKRLRKNTGRITQHRQNRSPS